MTLTKPEPEQHRVKCPLNGRSCVTDSDFAEVIPLLAGNISVEKHRLKNTEQ